MPAAESLVGRYRRRLDPAAALGVPAHVTVLYPFVEPTAINESVIATLTTAVASVSAFDCRFPRTRWFGDDVLWLEPEPAEPFRQLTIAVWDAFPQQPPYGGAHEDIAPHLTVAERRWADLPTVEAAEQALQSELPVATTIERAFLIAGAQAPGSWRVLHELPLRTADTLTD